ncbi:MAG: restriction endonuclease subunit S [Clostridia bacterium]|nr:restriction endonuclease subunit S [Clostridia bacterium]
MRRKVQLKEIASFSKGAQINGEELLDNGKFDYLNGGIEPSGKWNEFNVKGNTVTISEGGASCGFVNFMDKPFWCGAHCYYFFNYSVDPKYLYYSLKSQQSRLMEIRSGACMPNIKKTDLGIFEVEIDTDESEQLKVVKILQKVEFLISSLKKQLNLMDYLIKARFVEMFGDPATNPIHWDETTVGKECCYIKDGPHKSLPDIGKENGGHPFISVRNIVNHVIDFTTARYISDEDYKEARKKCCPEKGDMLYSKGGTTGIAKLIDVDIEFANWVHLAVLKFDKEKLNGLFFENMLNCEYCYDQSQKLTKGIANRDLVLSAMAQIKMYRPPKSLQDEFATFVQQVDKSKFVVQKALDKAQLLFDGLMQKYFG